MNSRYKAVFQEAGKNMESTRYYDHESNAIAFIRKQGNGRVIDTKTGEIIYNQGSRITGV